MEEERGSARASGIRGSPRRGEQASGPGPPGPGYLPYGGAGLRTQEPGARRHARGAEVRPGSVVARPRSPLPAGDADREGTRSWGQGPDLQNRPEPRRPVARDGKASGDRQILLFPQDGGPPLVVPRPPDGNVHVLDFGPQGDLLITGGSGESLRFWSLPDLREMRSAELERGIFSRGVFEAGGCSRSPGLTGKTREPVASLASARRGAEGLGDIQIRCVGHRRQRHVLRVHFGPKGPRSSAG